MPLFTPEPRRVGGRFFRAGLLACGAAVLLGRPVAAAIEPTIDAFIENRCADCHDADEKKGGLDLTALAFAPGDARNFDKWVQIFDRVMADEMPPKKQPRPEKQEVADFAAQLSGLLTHAEEKRLAGQGRATLRRLNRYEYENTVRDLLGAPWLPLRDSLPEDGEAYRFNKVGDSLDVSHVQMARYLATADRALRSVMAKRVVRPATPTARYYARDQASFAAKMLFNEFNNLPERATFPMLDGAAQPEVRRGAVPATVGVANHAVRERESIGVVASNYEPVEVYFENFVAPVSGRYRLRFKAFSVWIGPSPGDKWFIPDLDAVSRGRRSEPITVYSELPPRQVRTLGTFDVQPDATVSELDTYLLAGEIVRPDAARLFRSRPGAHRWQNPLATPEGQPGVSFAWMEAEGPIYDEWPVAGQKLLFGDLPVKASGQPGAPVEVISQDPKADAVRLLTNFLPKAYRRPVAAEEVQRFLPVVDSALAAGSGFTDAMLAAYTAVLSSPGFLYLDEQPGRLNDYALASRLSYFLWNSAPDAELLALAANGTLHDPKVLHAQTDRLLADPKSQRFVDAFLAYWVQLRKIQANSADELLYSDYYLDDLLPESAERETRAFFAELVRGNLPAKNIVSSDFVMINERLATHYGIPGVEGVAIRKVAVPADSPRGGLLTQASVLKVTANGTTTSPVLRGAWIMERILGQPVPPPPPDIPSIEPDIRGATTIRQILDKHRNIASCAGCHAKIDPAGFALENFDVMGGWRDHYRALGGDAPAMGIGHNGQKFAFHAALLVDSSGQLPDGRSFADIRSLKALLASDEAQIARNLTRQLTIFATGAPVRFTDRPAIEDILHEAAPGDYGVRTLIHGIVQSPLFLQK
jgi:hypothetical protein